MGHSMIQTRLVEYVEDRMHCAGTEIVGAVDHTRNTRMADRARTHRAGLEGDIERGTRQPIIANRATGRSKGLDFGR